MVSGDPLPPPLFWLRALPLPRPRNPFEGRSIKRENGLDNPSFPIERLAQKQRCSTLLFDYFPLAGGPSNPLFSARAKRCARQAAWGQSCRNKIQSKFAVGAVVQGQMCRALGGC